MTDYEFTEKDNRIAIDALHDAMLNGSITNTGRLPDVYTEVAHAVDISTEDGKAFNTLCTALLTKVRPQHDHAQNPVQFVLLDKDEPDAYILPDGKPAVIALSRGIIEKTKHNEAGLAWIIAHEYTHLLSHLERKGGHGKKLEEGLADHIPLDWIHDAGYSQLAAVEFIAQLFEADQIKALDTKKDSDRITSKDAEKVVHTIWDSHLSDGHRLAALTDRIGGTDVDRGQNSMARGRVPVNAPLLEVASQGKAYSFIDTLRNNPAYEDADPLEQLRMAQPLLQKCTSDKNWRIAQFQTLLSEITDDYGRYDWDEAGKDIDDADEELEAIGQEFLEALSDPKRFDALYPIIARDMLGERNPKKPAGSLKDVARNLQALVDAKSEAEFAKAYAALKPLLPTIHHLPVGKLTWPNFDTQISNFDEAFNTKSMEVRTVPWNAHSEWARNIATQTQDEGPLVLLLRMGAYDPRLLSQLSDESRESLRQDLEHSRGLGMPSGHNTGFLDFKMKVDENGKDVLAVNGYAPEKYDHMEKRLIAELENKKGKRKARDLIKETDQAEPVDYYDPNRLAEELLEEMAEEKPVDYFDPNRQIEAPQKGPKREKQVDFWPEDPETFIRTFPQRAKELSHLLKTPEILMRDPKTDILASIVRYMLTDNVMGLEAFEYETHPTLTDAQKVSLINNVKNYVKLDLMDSKVLDKALEVIEQEVYPSLACREILSERFASAIQNPEGAQLIRSFYLGRDDGLDYKHFFAPRALVDVAESLGCPFWDIDGTTHHGSEGRSWETKEASYRKSYNLLLEPLFTLEERLNFMEEHRILTPGSTRLEQPNTAYPVDDNIFWSFALSGGGEATGTYYSDLKTKEERQKYIDEYRDELSVVSKRGYVGHAGLIASIYSHQNQLASFVEEKAEHDDDDDDQLSNYEDPDFGDIDQSYDADEDDDYHAHLRGEGNRRDEYVDYDNSEWRDRQGDIDNYKPKEIGSETLNILKDIPQCDYLMEHCVTLLRTRSLDEDSLRQMDRILCGVDHYQGDSVTLAKMLSLVDHYDIISNFDALKTLKTTALESIENEQNPALRKEALEHLLFKSSLKDMGLQKKLIKFWADDQRVTLQLQGLPAVDDGSDAFKTALEAIISPVRQNDSASARYSLLGVLANSLQTQRSCSKLLKDAVYTRSDESIESTDNALRMGETVLTLTDTHAELRNAIVKFLSSETSPELTEKTTKITRKYLSQANQATYSQFRSKKISDERIQTSLLTYHENFWNMTLPQRAMIMSQLLLPANARDFSYLTAPSEDNGPVDPKKNALKANAKREYTAAFDSVVNTLFPEPKSTDAGEKSNYSKQAREMLHAYDTMLERTNRAHIRPVLLAILMSASQQSQQQQDVNIGERLALVLEMMGAAEIKTGQMAGGHKDTPLEIAEGLQRLKDKAAEPARWDMWDMIDQSVPQQLLENKHIGTIRGSASLWIAVDVNSDPNHAHNLQEADNILSLKRPYAQARAEQGFDMLNGVIEVVEEKGETFSPDFAKNLHEMVHQAKEMIGIETNTDIGVVQMQAAQSLKGNKSVSLSNPPEGAPKTITFHHAAWSDFGDGFRLMQKMPGSSFNSAFGIEQFRQFDDGHVEIKDSTLGRITAQSIAELPQDVQTRLEQKKAYAAAHWMMTVQTIVAGGPLEQDAHGGNWNVNPSTGTINSFDDGMIHATRAADGSIQLTTPSDNDLKALGSALCASIKALMNGKGESVDKVLQESMHAIAEKNGGIMPQHLLRVERALIALNDSSNYLTRETMGESLISLYKNKQMHPTIQKMVDDTLGLPQKLMLKAHKPAITLTINPRATTPPDVQRWHMDSTAQTPETKPQWHSTTTKAKPMHFSGKKVVGPFTKAHNDEPPSFSQSL